MQNPLSVVTDTAIASLIHPTIDTSDGHDDEEEQEMQQKILEIDVSTLEVASKIEGMEQSGTSEAKSQELHKKAQLDYLGSFPTPEHWDEACPTERRLYEEKWKRSFLTNHPDVKRQELTYYLIPDLRKGVDVAKRDEAVKAKKKLREFGRNHFNTFQVECYLSSSNPEVAMAAAERKAATKEAAKAARDNAKVSTLLFFPLLFLG